MMNRPQNIGQDKKKVLTGYLKTDTLKNLIFAIFATWERGQNPFKQTGNNIY